MRYLAFVRRSEAFQESPPPAEFMEAVAALVERLRAEGTLVDTGGLLPSREGARVRVADGKIKVTDGPFAESKEVIGGFAIIDVASKEEAVRVASEFMELHRRHWPGFEGETEVRAMAAAQ
jgi:hypothetical protein